MVTTKQIETGLAKYLDTEFMPNINITGIKKVLLGTAMSIAVKRCGSIINGFRDNKALQMMSIFDNEGNIDIDIVYETLNENMPDEGIKVEIPVAEFVVTIKKDDIDKLYEYIAC